MIIKAKIRKVKIKALVIRIKIKKLPKIMSMNLMIIIM